MEVIIPIHETALRSCSQPGYGNADVTVYPSLAPISGYLANNLRKLRRALCVGHLGSISRQPMIARHLRILFAINFSLYFRSCVHFVNFSRFPDQTVLPALLGFDEAYGRSRHSETGWDCAPINAL